MRAARVAALLAAVAAPLWGAIGYETFRHPGGDFELGYPYGWTRSYGIRTLTLEPPGPGAGRVSVQRFPGRGEPADAEAFLQGLLEESEGLRRVESRGGLKMGGRTAERLVLRDLKAVKGLRGETLPGPMRHAYVVVQAGDAYYVLSLRGTGDAFTRTLPEFDRLAGSFTVR